MTFVDRFHAKTEQSGECWNWTSAKSDNGYGIFWLGRGRSDYAHRLAWILANGEEIPEGMVVMHSCDNRLCVNPAHLNIGTHQENIADREAKGRGAKGERNGGSKLSVDQVGAIRAMHGHVKRKDVASLFEVHEGTIKSIWSRRNWKHAA